MVVGKGCCDQSSAFGRRFGYQYGEAQPRNDTITGHKMMFKRRRAFDLFTDNSTAVVYYFGGESGVRYRIDRIQAIGKYGHRPATDIERRPMGDRIETISQPADNDKSGASQVRR